MLELTDIIPEQIQVAAEDLSRQGRAAYVYRLAGGGFHVCAQPPACHSAELVGVFAERETI